MQKLLTVFYCKNVLTKHKQVCFNISGAQSVRWERGKFEFRNDFKQIPVPNNIYADSECNLKSSESYEGSHAKISRLRSL